MKSNTKIFFVSIITVLTICFFIGLTVRNSIKDIKFEDVNNNSKNYKYTLFNPINDTKDLNADNVINQLENNSDIIVEGKFTGYRKILSECILSEVKIITKYSGELESEYIYIYEPVQINLFYDSSNVAGTVISTSGYGLIRENKEYLFFLKAEDTPPGFNELKKSTNSYTYVNNHFSKLCTQYDTNNFKVINDIKRDIFYDEVAEYEQVFCNQDVFYFYNEVNKYLLNKYKNIN